MAIRLRRIKDGSTGWMALCAADWTAQGGDVYIDDNQDHALRDKYLADYESEGLIDGTRIKELEDAAREDLRLLRAIAKEKYEGVDAVKRDEWLTRRVETLAALLKGE